MAMQFQQTDTAGLSPGAYCSPSGTDLGVQTMSRHCAVAGTPGDSPGSGSTRTTNDQSAERSLYFSFTPGVEDWEAGTYKVRLHNRATSNFVTIERVDICRLNSGGTSQATIGSATGLGLSLSSSTVHEIDVDGAAQPTASDTDQIIVIVSMGSTGTGSWVVIGWDSDQIIDTPIGSGSAGENYQRSADTLEFDLRYLEPSVTYIPDEGTNYQRSAPPLAFDLRFEEPNKMAEFQRSAEPLQFDLRFLAPHHDQITIDPNSLTLQDLRYMYYLSRTQT